MSRGFLLKELVRRDLQGRYAGSVLGLAWAVLQPVWQLALFSVVFSWILKVPVREIPVASFPIFLFAGLLPWSAFQEGVLRGAGAIVENAPVVKKVRFPSALLVTGAVVGAMAHSAIGLVLFVAVLVARGDLAWSGLYGLIPAIALQGGLTLGIAWALAGLQVYLRDTLQVVSILLAAGFYLTPIVYPPALVPDVLARWLGLNPLATLVALYRASLLGGPWPSATAWIGLGVTATVALAVGHGLFRRLASGFADEL